MPIPSNLTALTAIDLGSPPASATQFVDFAGTTFTVWYRFTALSTDLVQGFFANGLASQISTPPFYRPTANLYLGPAASLSLIQSGSPNVPALSGVLPVEYFLEIVTSAGNPTPALLILTVTSSPRSPIPIGSILINDDTAAHPGAILSTDGGGTLNFLTPQVAGEQGDILANGVSVFNDFATGDIVFYDNQLNVLQTVALGTTPLIRTCHGADLFYVYVAGAPINVQTYDATGTLTQTFVLAGVAFMRALAAANDESILYYAERPSGSGIKRWDLPGVAALSDLAAGIAGYFVVDILVLGDDTIVASFHHTVTGDFLVRRYNAAGALLNTYNFGVSALPAGTFSRLAYAVDDPTSFWAWTHTSIAGGFTSSRFREVQVSDGTILTDLDNVTEYELGVYQGEPTASPDALYGPSFSCPFIVLRVAIPETNTPVGSPPTSTLIMCPGDTAAPRDDGIPYTP